VSPEHVLRAYFHAKDEDRPHLLDGVFSIDARLDIRNPSEQISFPAVTVGLAGIADVLVRRFNQAYENVYSRTVAFTSPTYPVSAWSGTKVRWKPTWQVSSCGIRWALFGVPVLCDRPWPMREVRECQLPWCTTGGSGSEAASNVRFDSLVDAAAGKAHGAAIVVRAVVRAWHGPQFQPTGTV
jgi:hypothetical protein